MNFSASLESLSSHSPVPLKWLCSFPSGIDVSPSGVSESLWTSTPRPDGSRSGTRHMQVIDGLDLPIIQNAGHPHNQIRRRRNESVATPELASRNPTAPNKIKWVMWRATNNLTVNVNVDHVPR